MPDWRSEIRARLSGLRLAPERETEIIEEVAQHLEDRYRELRLSGRTDADAAAEAWRELEAADVLGREVSRVERPQLVDLPAPGSSVKGRPLASLAADLRFAFRTLRKNPSFSIPVLLAMALSIGPTTAIVSLGNWLMWRPLPGVQRSNELGVAWFGQWFKDGEGMSPVGVSHQNIADLKRSATSIVAFAGAQERNDTLVIGDRLPEVTRTSAVTPDYFQALGLPIRVGRDFQPADDLGPFGSPVAIIGEGLAQLAFGSPAEAIGKKFTINRQPFEVIGVAPEGFAGINRLGEVRVWFTHATMPYVLGLKDTSRYTERSGGSTSMFVVRLAPGRRWSDVETELTNLSAGLGTAHPQDNRKFLAGPNREAVTPRVFPGLGEDPLVRSRTRRTVTLLIAVASVLVLLGCANVANLMVFRASKREREVAVRKALGASAARLIQLQLTESWLLAICGAGIGLTLAVVLKSILQNLMFPAAAGITPDIPFDLRVLGLTLAVATGTGIVAGLAPAWVAARSRVAAALGRSGSRNVFRTPRLRSGLAVVQLSLSLQLLIGAVLLVATVRNLHAVDLGFSPERLTTMSVSLSSQGYTSSTGLPFWENLQKSIHASGQFEDAAIGTVAPFGSKFISRVIPPGGSAGDIIEVATGGVSETYFPTVGMTLLRGRNFTAQEVFTPPGAEAIPVIVSDSMARKLYGSIDVLGRPVRFARNASHPEQDLPIIGVVKEAKDSLTGVTDPFVFMPLGRFEFGAMRGTITVRSTRPAPDVTATTRRLVAGFDKGLPVSPGVPLVTQIERRMSQQRLFAWTLSLLGGLGFVLAALGVYGLVAQASAERSREFAIRIAVGADRRHIARLVLRFAVTIAAMGTAGGVVLAYFSSRAVTSMLFGITALDPRVYVIAVIALTMVVLAACAIPVMRAMRVQPVDVLRTE
jgi:predicted permease